MEFKHMLKILLRWWWLAVIPVLIVSVYVTLTFQHPPMSYQIIMRFMAGGEPTATLSVDYDRYHAWLSSEYIARGLANIAKTGEFAKAVTQRLFEDGLDTPSNAFGIASDYAESVLVIYLTSGNREAIVPIANAISDELTQNGPAYFPQMGGIGTIARQVDEPVPTAMPPSLKAQLLGPALRVALAGGIGLGLVFLAHYLDPMTREPSEIEASGIPVVASIPKRRKS